jgi:hypothetical protein
MKTLVVSKTMFYQTIGKIVEQNKNGLSKIQILGTTYFTHSKLSLPNNFVYKPL